MNGIEWIVEAHGCPPDRLSDLQVARELFARVIRNLDLRVVGETQWHQFPTTGGITGLSLQSVRTHIGRTVWTFYWALAEGSTAQNRRLLAT